MARIFGMCDFRNIDTAEDNCYLLANGLGGFSSLTMAGSNARNDHAFFMAALTAPNKRYHIITNFIEKLVIDGKAYILSTSKRVNYTDNLYGYKYITSFSYGDVPEWTFIAEGIIIKKTIVMPNGKNAAGVVYKIEDTKGRNVKLILTPLYQCVPKGRRLNENQKFMYESLYLKQNGEGTQNCPNNSYNNLLTDNINADNINRVSSADIRVLEYTNAVAVPHDTEYINDLYYEHDARDGRDAVGVSAHLYDLEYIFDAENTVLYAAYELENDKASKAYMASDIYKAERKSYDEFVREYGKCNKNGIDIYEKEKAADNSALQNQDNAGDNPVYRWIWEAEMRNKWLVWLSDEADKAYKEGKAVSECKNDKKESVYDKNLIHELTIAADKFVTYRESTDGMSILAGFPFFCDWGRDTMIAITGCVIRTGRYETAKSILRTFMRYISAGVMPNLFPEGADAPMYNTVDAALLFFEAVNIYYDTAKDIDFVREAYPYMEEIIYNYSVGTKYSIKLNEDGLISAGSGLDQVTWMDAKCGDMVMTKRHGKPVEINAYWYNALRIAARFNEMLTTLNGRLPEKSHYNCAELLEMAEKTKKSFLEKFPRGMGLKDVLSENDEENQIRCNQIWTLSLSYIMPDSKLAAGILSETEKYLLTPYGLRSLAPDDLQYRPHYGGSQKIRDLAYHQGTVWAYPLGAYIIAKKRFDGADEVREIVRAFTTTLNEGCIGNIAEIFEAEHPSVSQGCFAQAWSVGEILKAVKEL